MDNKKKIAGIFVETPYQLFTAINIAKNHHHADECVLFLMEKMYLTNRKFQVVSSDPFISGIYYIQDYLEVGRLRHHLRRICGIIKGYPSKDYPNFLCYFNTRPKKFPNFSVLICNKYENIIAKLYCIVLRRNPEVYIIEDGLGDYVNKQTKIEESFKRIYYWSDYYNKIFNGNAFKAPQISLSDNSLLKIMSDLFPISKDDIDSLKKCKCLLFHQPTDSKNADFNEIRKKETEIIKVLSEKFGDAFYIKLHPRDDLNIYPNLNKINSIIPWEAMLPYIDDVSNKVLVGLHSTTLYSPKMVFDLEPKVIFLGSILDYWKSLSAEDSVKRVFESYDELENSYLSKNRVFIPESINDLALIAEKL